MVQAGHLAWLVMARSGQRRLTSDECRNRPNADGKMIDQFQEDQPLEPRRRRDEEAVSVGIHIKLFDVQGKLWSDSSRVVLGKVDSCSRSESPYVQRALGNRLT